MKVSRILADATRLLAANGVNEPRLQAASLLAFALGRDRTFLIAHPEFEPASDEALRFSGLLSRRANREPYQYIVGCQEFYGLDFEVTSDVLIPRPETEILVENAIARLCKIESPRFCEIGVGSGCILVSVLKNVESASAFGVDISENVLTIAAKNAEKHRVANRLELRVSDIYSAIPTARFDAILSNPPYVPVGDIASLQPEVGSFEPHTALTDGGDGLSLIRRVINGAPDFLASGGFLMIEIGFGQSESVGLMLGCEIWQSVEVVDDLEGIPRTTIAIRR